MKAMFTASAALFLLSQAAVEAQHHVAMHSQSGVDGYSACAETRYNGPIKDYPSEQIPLKHEVTSSSLEAKKYFNLGLTFYYGFDSESAMRAFSKALSLDGQFAMAHWGIALAAGGDLNIPINGPCMELARKHSRLANGLRGGVLPAERDYIDALAQRYATGPDSETVPRDQQLLGVQYMLAMKEVEKRLGAADPDAVALYAYSLMNLRPWLWWTTSGQKSAEIDEALQAVHRALARDLPVFRNHIGLHHIHVHAEEEGPIAQAGEAEASARFLHAHAPTMTPHLSHMPAHIFLLLGNWEGVMEANKKAVLADQDWSTACKDRLSDPYCNPLLVGHYYSHDMLFLAVGRANRGEWDQVKPLSEELEKNALRFLGEQPGLEHYLTTRVAMMVRFGKWRELTELPAPVSPLPDPNDPGYCAQLKDKPKLATAMWYFGQVMGKASLGQPTGADLLGFQRAQDCVAEAGIGWGNNPASAILKVVRWRMLERIARKKGLSAASQQFALLAVETEDLLDYDEPPGWYLSSRENYGAALFAAGNYTQALTVFTQDLARRPNNSRSLFGIWQTWEKMGKKSEAEEARKKFKAQWVGGTDPRMEDL